MPEKLQQAIALIRAGDRQQGSELLGEVLRENPDVELAWLWMSGVVDDVFEVGVWVGSSRDARRRGRRTRLF